MPCGVEGALCGEKELVLKKVLCVGVLNWNKVLCVKKVLCVEGAQLEQGALC